jgi:DNA repair exonuclease SbcCD ATPase subunit
MRSPVALDSSASPDVPASGAAASASASATAPAAPASATAPADPASATAPADPASATAPVGIPASSGDFARPPAPTLHVALPVTEIESVRAALSILAALPDRLEAQSRRDDDHAQLQHAFRRQARQIGRLKQELADLYTFDSPFVQHAQRQYDLLHHRYQEAVQRSAEFHNTLIDRQADAQELVSLRARLRTIEAHHAEEVAQLRATGDDLAVST